jgi:hypothetical protein
MQLESRLWVYALMRRPAAAPFAGEQHFSVHRQNGTLLQLPWGEREVAEVLLGMDEPERFMQAVRAKLVGSAPSR